MHGLQQTEQFLKIWEYKTTLPASWEICMQAKKQQLEPDVEQRTGSKLGKEDVKVGQSFSSKEQVSFNFVTAVSLCSNFGA